MCKVRGAGILAGLSRGGNGEQSEERSVPTVIPISNPAAGVESEG